MAYAHEPTLGLLELCSIARGVDAADRMLKQAAVRIVFARPVSPGKYLVLVTGSVEDVRSALAAGIEAAQDALVDRVFLPGVHDGVLRALEVDVREVELDALGVLETQGVAACIRAADAAAKRAAVLLVEMRLAQGIGGKSYFTLTGEVSDVEAALAAAVEVAPANQVVACVTIPRPHEDLRAAIADHRRRL